MRAPPCIEHAQKCPLSVISPGCFNAVRHSNITLKQQIRIYQQFLRDILTVEHYNIPLERKIRSPFFSLFSNDLEEENAELPVLGSLPRCSARRPARSAAGHTSPGQRSNALGSGAITGRLVFSSSLRPVAIEPIALYDALMLRKFKSFAWHQKGNFESDIIFCVILLQCRSACSRSRPDSNSILARGVSTRQNSCVRHRQWRYRQFVHTRQIGNNRW